jgi:hypothetical protein
MPIYKCPRCEGTESFVRTETVLRAGRTNVVNTTKMHNVEISVNICKKCGEKMQTILTDFDKKRENLGNLKMERAVWLFGCIVCFAIAAYLFIFSLNMMYQRLYPDTYSYPLEPYEIGIALGISILFVFFGFLCRKPSKRLKNRIQEEEKTLRE